MHSTIQLFKHLYNTLPPLFPEDIKKDMQKTLSSLETAPKNSLADIEDTMIAYGFEVWPWREAYKEFYFKIETSMGEDFLLPRLSSELQDRYHEFKKSGGTFEDIHRGRKLASFTSEDRQALCEALINMQTDLKKYVSQHLGSTEKKAYFSRVENYKQVVQEIKEILQNLKTVAEAEKDHPILADEINAKIRSFEESLCLLGGELNYTEVCQAPEFFEGRRQHLNKLKGINTALKVDFYGV